MRKKIKKIAASVCSVLICVHASSYPSFANVQPWDIENTLEVSECRQGDMVKLSVYLKGISEGASQEITSMKGTLEYDTSLFTVEKADILPTEADKVQEWSFDSSEGKFSIQYTSDITVKDKDPLLQIQLNVAEDAEIGKTTVCVTDMEWKDSGQEQPVKIEHRVPERLTISESEKVAGDVNGDGICNLTDARMIMQQYNGEITFDSQQEKNADVNSDGIVNLIDVKLVMQYYNSEIAVLNIAMSI